MAYKIFTDSSANLPDNIIEKYGLEIVSLVFVSDGKEYVSYAKGEKSDLKRFYSMLRDKKQITTSAINEDAFLKAFAPTLAGGEDILYLAFSSGLSASCACANNAAAELRKKYPERKLIVIDTLAASLGEGLLVLHACENLENGMAIEENAKWVEDNKLHLCHWFTVDDLGYLFRGGRVKAASYLLGTIMLIKPVMHMDNEGHLIPVSRVVGRKKSINALAEKLFTTITDKTQLICISHGDCIEDAEYLAERIREKVDVKDIVINYVDPVIGAHSGPGTLALFFLGEQR